MMADIKLVYFDSRARAEPARMVMAAAGKKWDDVRLTVETFLSDHKDHAPFERLPYLVYNGKTHAQSGAICNFLAREFGFYGKTNYDNLRIEEVTGLVEDLLQQMIRIRFGDNESRKDFFQKKLMKEQIPKYLGYFQKLLKENCANGYFVGNSITLADLAVYNITDTILHIDGSALSTYPEIQKLREVVAQQPKLKAYLACRKDQEF